MPNRLKFRRLSILPTAREAQASRLSWQCSVGGGRDRAGDNDNFPALRKEDYNAEQALARLSANPNRQVFMPAILPYLAHRECWLMATSFSLVK